ncbi:hypothetical protein [Acidithrix ferrooxidans]|uniref:Uncharacterized protein n=1 Tax=Acidithrix ferrooxidans TaxID=1280514 RepID=A0A0D8HFE8_9ACTN|nr:hypothetical protein [Acidithrix ferrooxidans]KJF16648.1 hypothetical protein AXFE_25110 [Acidithrix ferrooxidans]
MPIDDHVLYAYSIHGRNHSGDVIDYSALIRGLGLNSSSFQYFFDGNPNETLAVSGDIYPRDNIWELRFHQEILLDRADLQSPFRSLIKESSLFVDPDSRFVAIEKHRNGLDSLQISSFLQTLGRVSGFDPDLIIDLNPVISESFYQELQRYVRIRAVSLMMSRPNFNWTDNANEITDLAELSNAHSVEIKMSAPRGRWLSMDRGIVYDIKQLLLNKIGPLKSARVVGFKAVDGRESTLSSNSYHERKAISIEEDSSREERRSNLVREVKHFLVSFEPVAR